MAQNFDDAYAEYLEVLARLNQSDDIATKNALFRQLTELLARMEQLVDVPSGERWGPLQHGKPEGEN